MSGVLTDPSFGLPLVLASAVVVGLSAWAYLRLARPPSTVPRAASLSWSREPETIAHAALAQGRFFYPSYGLLTRLAALLWNRYGVRVERRGEVRRLSRALDLPGSVTLRVAVRDLLRAYGSALRAEEPGPFTRRWEWLARRRNRAARLRFEKAIAGLVEVFSALEVP